MFKHIVFSNLWIALGAVCLTLNFYLLNNLSINTNVLLFVFFATLFSYNFQRLIKIKFKINLKGERVDWIKLNKTGIYFITIIALIGSVVYGLPLIEKTWKLLLLIGLLTFFYVWKIPGFKGKSLRDIPTLKIFIIALVWVLFCVVFPTWLADVDINNLIVYSGSVFLLMIAITIPFDVRDMNLDAQTKKTIPQLIGERKAAYLSVVLFLLSQVGLIYLYPQHKLGLLIFMLIGSWILIKSKNKNKELYFSGIVDGLLVLQSLLIYLLTS